MEIRDILKTVDQSTIGSQADFFHDIFKRDEVFDIQIGFVVKIFGGRIEIDIEA